MIRPGAARLRSETRLVLRIRYLLHVRFRFLFMLPYNQSFRSNSIFSGTKYITIIYTEKIIAIKPTSTVTAATPISTSIVTATITSTSTVLPSNVPVTSTFSTTQTSTTTITASSTSTITTTTTITTSVTVTSYAACGPTNLLGPQIQNGNYIDDVEMEGISFIVDSDATTAYDCCVACFTSPDQCQYMTFYSGSGMCQFLGYGIVCNNPGYTAGTFFQTPITSGLGLILANGPCGVVVGGEYM